MRNVKLFVAAAAAVSAIPGVAFAADLPIALPPPIVEFGGWYLRGDIGFSNQQVSHLSNALEANLITQSQHGDFSSAGIYRLGAGYQVNNWFRADVTGEYRGNSAFHGYEINTFSNGGVLTNGFNQYTATKSEWLVLGNAYVDLGTWWCITPFIGAGIGGARVTIADYTDVGQTNPGGPSSAFGDTASRWNLAWALHAGLAYKISPGLTAELAYRYVDLGKGITGDVVTYTGTNAIYNPTTFKDITSHDVTIGLRWAIDPMPEYAPPPPLVTKG